MENSGLQQDDRIPAKTQADTAYLQSKIAEQAKIIEQLEERSWLDSNLTNLDDILRQNYEKPLKEFSKAVIYHICKQAGAIKGIFYTYDPSKNALGVTAGYGCTLESMGKIYYALGEGLVGESALSQETIYLTDIPKENAVVQSGLGLLSASALFIQPLAFNHQVYGVIELMFVKSLTPKYTELIGRMSGNVAGMLGSIVSSLETKKLLETSQEQANELRSIEEELRQNMEELNATQEQMRRSQTLILENEKKIWSILNGTTDAIFSTDSLGRIDIANEATSLLTGYSDEELKGMDIRRFLKFLDFEKIRLKQTVREKVIKKNGAAFIGGLIVTVMENDRGRAYLVFMRDISEDVMRESDLVTTLNNVEMLKNDMKRNEKLQQAKIKKMEAEIERLKGDAGGA